MFGLSGNTESDLSDWRRLVGVKTFLTLLKLFSILPNNLLPGELRYFDGVLIGDLKKIQMKRFNVLEP